MSPSQTPPCAVLSESPGRGTAAAFDDNRRSWGRHCFGQSPYVDFLIKPSFRSQRATLRDVSIRGVGLLLGRMLAPETVLAIRMRSLTAEQSWMSLARVRHVRRLESGIWVLGCQFPRQLSESDVANLVDDEVLATAQDDIAELSDHDLFTRLLGSAQFS